MFTALQTSKKTGHPKRLQPETTMHQGEKMGDKTEEMSLIAKSQCPNARNASFSSS